MFNPIRGNSHPNCQRTIEFLTQQNMMCARDRMGSGCWFADERCFPPMGKDRLTHQALQIKAAKKALGCRETKAFTVMFNFWVAIDQKHREMRTVFRVAIEQTV